MATLLRGSFVLVLGESLHSLSGVSGPSQGEGFLVLEILQKISNVGPMGG